MRNKIKHIGERISDKSFALYYIYVLSLIVLVCFILFALIQIIVFSTISFSLIDRVCITP